MIGMDLEFECKLRKSESEERKRGKVRDRESEEKKEGKEERKKKAEKVVFGQQVSVC